MGTGNWLLQAAIEHRERELLEAHGKALASDACDAGKWLSPRSRRPKATVIVLPTQLDLWSVQRIEPPHRPVRRIVG